MNRRISVLIVFALFAVACAPEEAVESTTTAAPETTTSTTSTTTTVPPTTTSTIPPFTVEGAPPGLAATIEGFYAYASGEAAKPPLIVKPVLQSIKPGPVETPRSGKAWTGTFKGDGVATAKMGDDIFLAVNRGKGWRIVGGKWPSLSIPNYFGPQPRLVAVVGSDARPGEDILATRTDSIHFVGLDGAGRGGILGIPRDSWVPIAGGGSSKINAALSLAGTDGMMETFRDLSGLPLEGYVMTGFAGFEEMIGAVLGNFELFVPEPMHDTASKANFEAGPQVVDGNEALAFSRTRKTLPNGDFDRSANQGLLMLDVMRDLKEKGFRSIPGLMELSEPFMMTDLNAQELLTFAALTIASNPEWIPNVVAPGGSGWAGSASVVHLSDSASELWADLADGRLGG
jgi:LCP family protein required for cell wall assembly